MRTGKLLRAAAATAAVAGCVLGYFGQSPREAAAQPPAGGQQPKGVRVAECNICHLSENEGTKKFSAQFGSDKFITFDSGKIWEDGDGKVLTKPDYKGDPHKYVFKALDPVFSPAAKKMERLLANGDANYKLVNDVRCLGCHGHDTKPDTSPKVLDQFVRDAEVGLGCTGCHGDKGEGDWQYKHYSVNYDTTEKKKVVSWRKTEGKDKEAAGQVNLRDPAVKGQACAACHVGNAKEGKVVTHDMYAAGHPWLPPFELGTFLESEPPHWATPDKLSGFATMGTDEARKFFRVVVGEDYFARHVAVGAIMSLKMEMEQLVGGAAAATPGTTLDYARFDCAACHHELRIPSERQKQGFAGRVPGRVPLKSWTNGLPRAVVSFAAADRVAEFDKLYADVTAAATAKPFGDPARITTAATAMMTWCDQFMSVVNVDGKLNFINNAPNPKDNPSQKLIDACAVRLSETAADPEAAAQLLWAMRELTPPAERAAFGTRLPPDFKFPFNVREAQVDWLKVFSDADNWAKLSGAFDKK